MEWSGHGVSKGVCAGNEPDTDLPVKAERLNGRLNEFTEAGRIGLADFFSVFL